MKVLRSPRPRLLAAVCAASLVAAIPAGAQAGPAAAAQTASASGASAATAGLPVYLNTHYSFAERAADLVSRMTLSEKVAQLQTNSAPAIPRLGVQQYTYWSEGQHGVNTLGADTNRGSVAGGVHATSFPVNFASSMTWDPQLTYQETSAISDEVRGFLDKSLWGTGQNNLGPAAADYGSLTFWAPNVNMDRDPLWGRTNESFGEDPFLTSTMADAFVDGYQGETITGQSQTPYLKVAATAKHYALNNVEDSRHTGSSNTTDANIRDYYTKQFASLVENAHVSGIMTSYNAVNGTPSPANTYTVDELLQATYGFAGYTTSDCGAIGDIYSSSSHDWAPPGWTTNGTMWTNTSTGKQISAAAGGQAYAIRAGTQLNCAGGELTSQNINAAIDLGILSSGVIDSALTRLFTTRMETGEFDPASKVAYTSITKSQIESPAHQTLAEQIAANDIVLLQNNNVSGTSSKLLPVNPAGLSSVVVVGNLANTVTLGGYSGDPTLQVNAVQGITSAVKAANPAATVTFDACGTSTTATTAASCSAATQAAIKTASLVIVVAGSDLSVADEGNDRSTLALPGNYDSLISQVSALGNPRTALVMQADGPYDIQQAQQDFPAIVFSGYNGESQGTALAQVLFGQQNPAGHLNFTWYANDSQLAAMNNYGLTPSQTGGLGRTYMYFTGTPTYPFGYGLSYSTYKYSNINVGPATASADGTVRVGFDVTNTGAAAGTTVAQLYVAPPGAASSDVENEQLAGFQKTKVLQPGQTQHITLSVKVSSLSTWDETSLKQVVADGAYQFRVATDAAGTVGSGTVTVHGAITPQVQSVAVQPDQVAFQPGQTLDLTGTNPWIAPDTNSSLEQNHASASNIVEAVDNDQSFADLSHAHVTYSSSDPRVATVSDAGVVTMRAPGAATILVRVNGVTGSTPIVVQDPFTLQAPAIVKPATTMTATETFTNTGTQAVRGLQFGLTAPSGWTVAASTPVSLPSVGPGQQVTASWNVTIPGTASPGTQTELDATTAFTGAAGPYTEGAVNAETVTSGATPEKATPVITGTSPAAGSLQVVLDNPSDTPTTVTGIDWKLGSNSGTQPVSATIAAGSTATVTVPVTGISFATIYPLTVTSVISGGLSSEALSGHVTFLPVVYKSLGSSWTVADVQDGPYVDLATTADGTWGSLVGSLPYGGSSYLSGKMWFNWDATNLYITADITEAAFSQLYTGGNIWQGDSLQVAATSDVPGSSATTSTASVNGHYEYGAALTPSGSQLYRWTSPSQGSGQVTDATVNVTRDDTNHTTLYQVALPWSDLTSVSATPNTVFSISTMLNNVDTGVRNGYLEWGGGIGDNKNVAEFNMAQLMPAS
ncbi:glycoside hydrolase family 3 C-terminal domain-containing protein [Actinospica sp.]|uniref:glycoside hydrolase family 3 C-terminal domain-containing protein n=1 Tax=Actinospica sp. TaxID=1872142 RepID=UPI002CD7CCB9|nr:glycoside hydrolase family 3 C-terminal domain-containing protein [Actinospica sp.]HWG26462.1 glycoside hydrolase family 3 C-terminal domain-containing protein [Actinospica sp.]